MGRLSLILLLCIGACGGAADPDSAAPFVEARLDELTGVIREHFVRTGLAQRMAIAPESVEPAQALAVSAALRPALIEALEPHVAVLEPIDWFSSATDELVDEIVWTLTPLALERAALAGVTEIGRAVTARGETAVVQVELPGQPGQRPAVYLLTLVRGGEGWRLVEAPVPLHNPERLVRGWLEGLWSDATELLQEGSPNALQTEDAGHFAGAEHSALRGELRDLAAQHVVLPDGAAWDDPGVDAALAETAFAVSRLLRRASGFPPVTTLRAWGLTGVEPRLELRTEFYGSDDSVDFEVRRGAGGWRIHAPAVWNRQD